jgi:hypothetical protein
MANDIQAGVRIELIEGTRHQPGGYRINGRTYESEEAEALADEARGMAIHAGCSIEDVLASIVPAGQLLVA